MSIEDPEVRSILLAIRRERRYDRLSDRLFLIMFPLALIVLLGSHAQWGLFAVFGVVAFAYSALRARAQRPVANRVARVLLDEPARVTSITRFNDRIVVRVDADELVLRATQRTRRELTRMLLARCPHAERRGDARKD